MYEYKPVRTNSIAKLLIIAFLLLALLSFAVSAIVPGYAVIPQTVGLILLVPMIQIMTRFVTTRYLYRVQAYGDGNADFEVYSYRGGARMQLVCRVGLEEITAIEPLTPANRKAIKGLRRYNYSPDIRPKNGMILSVTNADGDCQVLICPDDRMTALLTPNAVLDLMQETEQADGGNGSEQAAHEKSSEATHTAEDGGIFKE